MSRSILQRASAELSPAAPDRIRTRLARRTARRQRHHVPTVLPAADGRRVVTVNVNGTERHVVHFAMVAGRGARRGHRYRRRLPHAGADNRCAARAFARTWTRPAGFSRFAWDWHAQPRRRGAVGQLAGRRRRRRRRTSDCWTGRNSCCANAWKATDSGPDRFGLIHADLRLANLLVDGSTITVIDFDDCGFGWFFYDFGTAVSFIEDDPALPEWQDSWLAGYRTRRPIAAADEDMLASFVFRAQTDVAGVDGTPTAIPRNPAPRQSHTRRAAAHSPSAISVQTAVSLA